MTRLVENNTSLSTGSAYFIAESGSVAFRCIRPAPKNKQLLIFDPTDGSYILDGM